MKKLISVLLLVFAIGFVVTGCKKEQPVEQPAVIEEKPADAVVAPVVEEKKVEVKK